MGRPLPGLAATFSRIWPRRIAIFLPFRPADCSMERQCARPVRRWSICLNGQRHRPAAHNGRVGCQGHKSISRKCSKVARCIERERRRAAVFAVSRALTFLPLPSRRFDDSLAFEPGKNTVHTSTRSVTECQRTLDEMKYNKNILCKITVTMGIQFVLHTSFNVSLLY